MTYPSWICALCGMKYGRAIEGHCATFHVGDRCGWCGEEMATTEPRDYGHPRAPGKEFDRS